MADIKDQVPHNSNSSSTPDNATRIFPPYLLWFVLIPALPFLFSIATLSFFINPTQTAHEQLDKKPLAINTEDLTRHSNNVMVKPPIDSNIKDTTIDSNEIFVRKLFDIKIDYIDQPQKTLTHLSNLLIYFSTTAVHGIVCLIVICFFLYQIHQLPKALIRRTYLYITVTTVAFFMVAYVVSLYANNLMLTQLGYKSICILLSKAELQTSLVWPDAGGGHTGEACFLPENTRLVWLAYTPIMLGVLAIIAASALTTVMASEPIPSANNQWRKNFLSRIKLLQKSFYLLSLVLVTSTITILYFTSLPLELLEEKGLTSALEKFFNGLTAFWGGLFTATLFATFAPAVLLFIKHTRRHQTGPTTSSDLGQWLYETVFVSIKKQAMNVLVIIAPMLVGPFSELLKSLSGLSG